jgi:predicted transcriptional regulator
VPLPPRLLLRPSQGLSPPLAGFFFGDEMSKKDEILNCCRDQARNAGEIASLLELDKTVVKITLLYCFKRGLVTREKRDRPAQVRGPKQEFFYLCQQS